MNFLQRNLMENILTIHMLFLFAMVFTEQSLVQMEFGDLSLTVEVAISYCFKIRTCIKIDNLIIYIIFDFEVNTLNTPKLIATCY